MLTAKDILHTVASKFGANYLLYALGRWLELRSALPKPWKMGQMFTSAYLQIIVRINDSFRDCCMVSASSTLKQPFSPMNHVSELLFWQESNWLLLLTCFFKINQIQSVMLVYVDCMKQSKYSASLVFVPVFNYFSRPKLCITMPKMALPSFYCGQPKAHLCNDHAV